MKVKMYYGLRFMQISGLLAVLILILIQLNELRISSDEVRYQQTETFSSTLTNLAAAEASRYFVQEEDKELQLLMDELSNDPMVRDATIYNQLGKILYQSKDPLSLPSLLKIDNTSSSNVKGIMPHIAELYKEGEKIGYIRVSLQQDHILGIIFNYQTQSLQSLIWLLSLSFLAGGILIALFYRRIENWYYRLTDLIPNLIATNKKL